MSYYVLPYQVLFHDTMAYGSHHHMTNFKFQNYARETMLFGSDTPGSPPWQEQLKDIVMLTREAYSFNLAPVNLGEKVGIVMSYEEPTRSTVRLCFRTIRQDGVPVNCGFQTMVLVDKNTGNLVPGPQIMTQFLDRSKPYCILEEPGGMTYKEKVLKGLQKEIFTPQITQMATFVANSPKDSGHPRILDVNMREYSLSGAQVFSSAKSGTLVFTFPGQGAYSYETLRQIYETFPNAKDTFKKVDDICQQLLGKPFTPLILANNKGEHDRILAFYPDLNQIGIYLSEVLIAEQYFKRGLKPDLLLGHSFGEIAALAMAGVYSLEKGVAIVCHRVRALHQVHARGCMAAAYCDKEKANAVLHQMGDHSLEITVSNHPKQTVVSGTFQDVDNLATILAKEGISLTKLNSAYPFHSSFLNEGVAPFRQSLKQFDYQPAQYPVYHCTENTLYQPGEDLAEILATQFIKTLDFRGIMTSLHHQGYKQYVECGVGNTLTKIVQKNFPNDSAVLTYASEKYGKSLIESIEENIQAVRAGKSIDLAPPQPAAPKTSPVRPISKTVSHTPAAKPGHHAVPPVKPLPSRPIAKPVAPTKKPMDMPVAIVSAGCFLPAAKNPDLFWSNTRRGVNGVKNLGETDPLSKVDFVAGSVDGTQNIIPDKTYALITGNISKEDIGYEEALLKPYYDGEAFNTLTRGQRLLAVSLAQLKLNLKYKTEKEIPVIIGSTADGSSEYDDATFLEHMLDLLGKLDLDADKKAAFKKELEAITGYTYGQSEDLRQVKVYREVVERIFDDKTHTYVVDSACSSSLYSLNLGIKALLNHEADVVLAGGVFAPGPANNTLFAQFRGLTPNQSRPLDHKADGVVFSDGGCMVALKRLSDAMAEGDEILGVIRGMGLSSDGKSPSINVPQSKGQSIAVERAYQASQIDPGTIQYIEAHATSTPVGDSVEFNSLKSYFGQHANGRKIELGSAKALIGHTGWVSGVASVLKMCYAFKDAVIPKQFNYESPNPQIDLASSPFHISVEEKPWTSNINGLPRRAGINSFGFGGTNGHLILEAYDPVYHARLLKEIKNEPRANKDLVLVDLGQLFPGEEHLEDLSFNQKALFDRSKTRLPKKKMLLPDVVEHMDISQFLAPLAVEQIMDRLPAEWINHKEEVGVVLGMMAKTDRGTEANERVFLDRLNRLFSEKEWPEGKIPKDITKTLEALTGYIKEQKMVSGPYTLPGLMPNVTSSRINSLFDLKGANFVIDMNENSLTQAIVAAGQLLKYGDCKMVFAGTVNARKSIVKEEHEGALIMALATEEFAKTAGLPIKGYINLESTVAKATVKEDTPYFGAAQGILDLIDQANQVSKNGKKVDIISNYAGSASAMKISLAGHKQVKLPTNGQKKDAIKESDPFEFIAKTKVYQGTPVLVAKAAGESNFSLKDRKLLIVTDQLEWLQLKSTKKLLEPYQYQIVTTGKENKAGDFINLQLQDEAIIQESVKQLNDVEFDTLLVLKNLSNYAADALLEKDFTKEHFHELLFAVCKYQYERIEKKELIIGTLSLDAFEGAELNPYTGIVSGFMKSVLREKQEANIRIVNSSETKLDKALLQLEKEFGQTEQDWEVSYQQGERKTFQFRSFETLSKPDTQYIDQHSVMLVTGGGRGVTAVLVEKLLETYGCTVIALGRTSLEGVPEHILEMSTEAYKAYESTFYKEELARDKTQKMPALKKQYWRYQAANELAQVIKTCEGLDGKYEYVATDINDKTAINKLIKKIFKDHGRLDVVVHGAGVQVSKLLPRKDFWDFQRIVSTKLLSLNHIYKACEKQRGEHKVHYHLLTSAFSYMGNDGQPDYGAANETMNRLAANMNNEEMGIYWTSMAWLGWAGIGMTRGSEFAALAMRRKLRGITKEEGQFIFMDAMNGAPKAPTTVLLAGGEIDFYDIHLENELTPIPFPEKEKVFPHQITVENTPILTDHKIQDIPTIPGAMVISMAGDAAKKMRPELHIEAFQDTGFLKFNRVFEDRGLDLRIDCQIVEETTKSARIRVRFMTDFYHKNGMLLQKDIILTETYVKMSDQVPKPILEPLDGSIEGNSYPDPYVSGDNSNVSLSGHFDAMKNITVGEVNRTAGYHLKDEPMKESALNYLIPNMIMVDAFWRFGTVQPVGENKLAVFVPEKCGEMRVFFDFTQFDLDMLKQPLTFVGINPRVKGDQLEVGPIQVLNQEGQVILLVEKGVCRKFDEIEIPVAEAELQ